MQYHGAIAKINFLKYDDRPSGPLQVCLLFALHIGYTRLSMATCFRQEDPVQK